MILKKKKKTTTRKALHTYGSPLQEFSLIMPDYISSKDWVGEKKLCLADIS